MKHIKVENTTFVRDPETMALLQTDVKARDEYASKKKLLIENKKLNERLTALENVIKKLIEEKKEIN
jgi:hypothetical protein